MCRWLVTCADAPSDVNKIRQHRVGARLFEWCARIGSCANAASRALPGWWNADTASLNLAAPRGRAGSSPAPGTSCATRAHHGKRRAPGPARRPLDGTAARCRRGSPGAPSGAPQGRDPTHRHLRPPGPLPKAPGARPAPPQALYADGAGRAALASLPRGSSTSRTRRVSGGARSVPGVVRRVSARRPCFHGGARAGRSFSARGRWGGWDGVHSLRDPSPWSPLGYLCLMVMCDTYEGRPDLTKDPPGALGRSLCCPITLDARPRWVAMEE